MDSQATIRPLQKMKFAESKAGGKVVQVSMEYDKVIREIKITGDFFIHPEEGVMHIEQNLIGRKIEDVMEVLEDVTEDMELVGITKEVLMELIKQCGES